MDDQKQDVAASQWHGMDDGDDAIERHSTILQQNIRNNHIRHQNEKRALERNNTKLLVRIDELEREHAELKRHLEAAMQTPSLAATQTELPSEANTYAPPRSSATVPTQDATVPFQEYKELERMYKDALRENDELRQKSERLATKHDIMKARVKEWNVWTAKNRAKKENSQRVGKGKSSKGFQVDVNTPPTPVSIGSSPLNLRDTPQPGGDADKLRQMIAEQSALLLASHESPLTSVTASLPEMGTPRAPRLLEPPAPHAEAEDELPQAKRNAPNEQIAQQESIQISSEPQKPQSEVDLDETNSRANRSSPRVTSSQTTQDIDEDYEHMDVEKPAEQHHSDDEDPVIVSERSLKRKHPAHVEVYQDPPGRCTEPPPIIKAEPRETQVASYAIPALLNRASTIDLDAVGLQIQTPRKRRRMEKVIGNSQIQPDSWSKARPKLHRERSSSLPVALTRGIDAAESIKPEPQDENTVLEVPDSDPSPIAEEDDDSMDTVKAVLTRSPNNPRKTKALRSRDVNIRPQPFFETIRPRRSRRRDEGGRGAKAVPMLSEDGEETQIRDPSPAKMQESRRRLAELYDHPPPEKKILSSPRTPATGRATRTTPRTTAGQKLRTMTPKPQSPPTSKSSKKKSSTPQTSTPQTSIKHPRPGNNARPLRQKQLPGQPLRSKSPSDLQLSDFKINPAANAGLDFAYSEVVRSREARACLPGCTSPDCCGRELRAMIAAGLNPPLPRSFWDTQSPQDDQQRDSSNNSDDDDDHAYLRWYLGSSYDADRVFAMPAPQRAELVVQAKVKLLANQAGRHRHAHVRARSPPGFWRADFPGTQEQERDREEARRIERGVVEERWREAMCEGGKWIFRDE